MDIDPKAERVLAVHRELTRERSTNAIFDEELSEYVRTNSSDGNGRAQVNDKRKVYDGTAPWALEQLASGLHTNLSSPVDQWFDLTVANLPYDKLDKQSRMWLEETTSRIYAHYSNPFGNFNPTLHEAYLDLATYGTCIIQQWFDTDKSELRFRSYPFRDCYLRENNDGFIDTVQVVFRWSIRQLRQEFGSLPPELEKMAKNEADMVKVIHEVRPRTDRDLNKKDKTNKAWSSIYVCVDSQEVLDEGGYDDMPYHAARWTKVSGEVYGRGPARAVLPEIRMVNAMSKSMVVAAQKLIDPALQVPDDGFLMPLRPNPGGLNYRRSGAEQILPMPGPTQIPVAVEMIEQRREMIRRGFYVDWLVRPSKRERQTAQEIMDDRNQMLAMLAPIVGRIQGELLGPLVRLSYNLLTKYGQIDPQPGIMQGLALDIRYTSPAAKAQATARGQGMMAFVQNLVQLQPVFPTAVNAININAFVAEMADIQDVPQRVLNDPEEVERKEAEQAKQQQLAEMTQAAPAVAKSAKDFAAAQQSGLDLSTLQGMM